MADDQPRKAKRHRSPTYPSIDLAAALRRAEQLYRAENRHFAPISAVLQAWEYSPKSSGGRLAVAALKRYGLLEDQGSLGARKARITDLAQAIILDQREESEERLQRIRDAALNVPIIREILQKYEGDLPSDATLRYHLTVERNFSPGGAEEFIDVLRKTLVFAQLPAKSVTVLDDEGGSASTGEAAAESSRVQEPRRPDATLPSRPQPPLPAAPAVISSGPAPIQFPVSGGATITLQSTAPLTEAAWEQMMTVLKALKSAIVVSAPNHGTAPLRPSTIQVGDLVDWESQGVVHAEALTVRSIEEGSDGRLYAHVEGSDSGIPLDQLTATP